MPRAKLTPQEQKLVTIYFELLQRYSQMEADKMLPLVAVRVLFLRRGYDGVLDLMNRANVDLVAKMARDQFTEMGRIWSYMIHNDPPPPPVLEDIRRSIKMTLEAVVDKEIGRRIYAFLSRVEQREVMLRQRDRVAKKASKAL